MGSWEALYYRGLTVEVIKPEPGFLQPPPSEPYVWRIVITRPRWVTRSGLRVGQSRERALAILGAPAAEEQDGAVTTLHYYTKGFDGMFWIQLKKDVITELGVSEDWS